MNKIRAYKIINADYLAVLMLYKESINRNVIVWGEGVSLGMSVILLYVYELR